MGRIASKVYRTAEDLVRAEQYDKAIRQNAANDSVMVWSDSKIKDIYEGIDVRTGDRIIFNVASANSPSGTATLVGRVSKNTIKTLNPNTSNFSHENVIKELERKVVYETPKPALSQTQFVTPPSFSSASFKIDFDASKWFMNNDIDTKIGMAIARKQTLTIMNGQSIISQNTVDYNYPRTEIQTNILYLVASFNKVLTVFGPLDFIKSRTKYRAQIDNIGR